MQARQIMTTPVLTVRPDTTVREAATLLLEHQITAAPVLDAGGDLIGIVSESDLVVDRFGHDPRNQVRPVQDEPPGPQTVGEVMTTPVIALGPSADAADLAQTMLGADVRSIPIVEGATVSASSAAATYYAPSSATTTPSGPTSSTASPTTGVGRHLGRTGHRRSRLIVGDLDDDGRAAVALARTVPGVGSVHLTAHRTPTAN